MPQQSTTGVSLSVVRDRQIPNGYRLTCHNRCLFICCDQAIATYRGGVNVPQQSTTGVSLSVVRDRQIPNGYRLTCHNRCLFICCDQAIATYRGGVNVPQQVSLNLANLVNPAPASIVRMKKATMPRNVCLILLNLVNLVNPAQSCKSCKSCLCFAKSAVGNRAYRGLQKSAVGNRAYRGSFETAPTGGTLKENRAGRIRTYACRFQRPVPYRLATALYETICTPTALVVVVVQKATLF